MSVFDQAKDMLLTINDLSKYPDHVIKREEIFSRYNNMNLREFKYYLYDFLEKRWLYRNSQTRE